MIASWFRRKEVLEENPLTVFERTKSCTQQVFFYHKDESQNQKQSNYCLIHFQTHATKKQTRWQLHTNIVCKLIGPFEQLKHRLHQLPNTNIKNASNPHCHTQKNTHTSGTQLMGFIDEWFTVASLICPGSHPPLMTQASV